MGVRVALGAQRSDVLRLMLGQAVGSTLGGVAIGLASAAALAPVLKSVLFGVSARDPLTFAGVAAVLRAVAPLACYLPARRAMKADPRVAHVFF
jgi:putative ABC transport system permease protein